MTQEFDKDYWESHWQQLNEHGVGQNLVPNPYLAREVSDLSPGTALDAGCGEGAETIWLANEGWQVSAADISANALSHAGDRVAKFCAAPESVRWIEADLSIWEPETQFDLVTTHYAHPVMPQLAFYERISGWVAPGGTLLIVGHLDVSETPAHKHSREPAESRRNSLVAAVTATSVAATLNGTQWDIVTSDEPTRTITKSAGRAVQLNDVVVRATRHT